MGEGEEGRGRGRTGRRGFGRAEDGRCWGGGDGELLLVSLSVVGGVVGCLEER